MPAFEGPYVSVPRPSPAARGFLIYLARETITTEYPIGIVPENYRDKASVEDTARLFAAAPLLLKSLQCLAAAPDLDPDLLVIVEHAINVATKDQPAAPAA